MAVIRGNFVQFQTGYEGTMRKCISICAMSCIVGDVHPDLVRVASNKLAGLSDIWLLAHPDLVDLPAIRAVINFVTECSRLDRKRLLGM